MLVKLLIYLDMLNITVYLDFEYCTITGKCPISNLSVLWPHSLCAKNLCSAKYLITFQIESCIKLGCIFHNCTNYSGSNICSHIKLQAFSFYLNFKKRKLFLAFTFSILLMYYFSLQEYKKKIASSEANVDCMEKERMALTNTIENLKLQILEIQNRYGIE